MVTPFSCSQPMFESPRRNQSSSTAIDLKCTFLVVISGKPSLIEKRIWWPNTLRVPVPVRSDLATPFAITCFRRSSYCVDFMAGMLLGRRRG